MTATVTRLRRRNPAPIVVREWTQRWVLVEGEWYRNARVVLPSGRERVLSISPDLTRVVAA
jgi:hypothetical protein